MKKIILLLLLFTCYVGAQEPEASDPFSPDYTEKTADTLNFRTEFFYMLFLLGMIVVILFIVSWLFKKTMSSRIVQMNEGSDIKVVESRVLSTKLTLHYIEFEGKKILVGESATGVCKLTEFPTRFEEVYHSKQKT